MMAKTLTITSIAVTINGNDYSKHVMFPFKVSNLLDEQLDEASLTLIGVPEKNFKPLTDVIVTLKNDNKTQSYSMLVASDKADEIPTGSGRYKHELYLIEQTKYLECFISRSIGFVNPLQKEYAQINSVPTITADFPSTGSYTLNPSFYYLTPLYVGDEITLKSIDNNFLTNPSYTMELYDSGSFLAKTEVFFNGEIIKTIDGVRQGETQFKLNKQGIYTIEYSGFDFEAKPGGDWIKDVRVTYFINVL